MNYTKGEWKVADKRTLQGSFMILSGSGNSPLARVYTEANAHLIAAAPRMYEALKAIEHDIQLPELYLPSLQTAIHKVLTKAEGEEVVK